MESGYKIEWSEEAIRNLDGIIDYLKREWTDKEIIKFVSKLDKAINLISTNPNLFRLTNKRKNIRRCVLMKQVSIYFRHTEDTVYIISIFDTRQNPAKLKD